MSPELLSKFSSLLTNVRLNQGLSGSGLSQVEVNGGWRLNAYRDIPIIETTSTSAIDTMRPTITLTAGAGGGLSDGSYFIRIAPMTYEGEQVASIEQSITLAGGTAVQSIAIALSDIHKDSTGAINCYSYKIYISQTTGTEKLKKEVSAYIYDSEGSPIAFNGVGAGNQIVINSLTAGADVPSHMQNDVPLEDRGSGIMDELMYLWDLDPIQGLGKLPYTNVAGDQFNGLVTTKPLAEVDDYIQFLVKSYCALTPAFEGTSVLLRGVRRA